MNYFISFLKSLQFNNIAYFSLILRNRKIHHFNFWVYNLFMNKNSKLCPRCKHKLVKNGIRNGRQRLRCSNPNCNYSSTQDKKTPQKQKEAFGYMYCVINRIQKTLCQTYSELPKGFNKIKLQKRDIKFTINDPSQADKINNKSCVIIAEDNTLHIIQFDKCKSFCGKEICPSRLNKITNEHNLPE